MPKLPPDEVRGLKYRPRRASVLPKRTKRRRRTSFDAWLSEVAAVKPAVLDLTPRQPLAAFTDARVGFGWGSSGYGKVRPPRTRTAKRR